MQGATYTPRMHEILPDSGWVTSLKQHIGERAEGLFLMRHKITESFVLATWWQKPSEGKRAVLCELFSFKDKPESLRVARGEEIMPTPCLCHLAELPTHEMVSERLKPAVETGQEMLRAHEKGKMERLQERRNQEEEVRDLGRFIKKNMRRANEPVCDVMIETGTIPTSVRQLKEE